MAGKPKLFSRGPLLGWSIAAACLGVGGSLIPWGTPTGFHGAGMPVFIVAWDRSPSTGRWMDYPNPLAFALNPLLIFFVGCLLWFLWWLADMLFRLVVRPGLKRQPEAPQEF